MQGGRYGVNTGTALATQPDWDFLGKMISRAAIDQFLDRPLDSFKWMKKLKRRELVAMLNDLNPRPRFHLGEDSKKPMWKHQIVSFLIGVFFPQFLFFMDMGSGKTRVILELISYYGLMARKKKRKRPSFLICVPNKGNIEDWLDAAQEFTPSLKCVGLDVPDRHKKLLLEDESIDVYISHYPGVNTLVSTLKIADTESGKRKWSPDKVKIRLVKKRIQGICLDESTVLMNKGSLTSRNINKISNSMEHRWGLTGTPFGKDPIPLHGQFYIIDRGETLGKHIGLFREVFFKKKKNYWGGWIYTFKLGRTKDLHRIIGHRSITYTEKECIDLPKEVQIKRIVLLPEDMDRYYSSTLEVLRKSKGGYQETKNSYLRMRQLSSGFLGIKNDETGVKAKIEFPVNPKLEELVSIIKNEMRLKDKIVVFHEFVWSGKKIRERLKAEKIGCAFVGGGQKDPRLAIRKFRKDPKVRVLVVNNNSGAMGLNLQVARYLCFFESPDRPILWTQARRRIRRAGQKAKRVFTIYLIARSSSNEHSVDDRIRKELIKGNNLLMRVLKGRSKI